MKATIILDKYPVVYKVELEFEELISHLSSNECTVSISPFANCQTFSIGHASIIANIKDEFMNSFMELLLSTTGKYQLVIDLLNSAVKPVLGKLEPYISWKKKISYINRTDAPMTLFLIKLDEDKMIELYRNKS